MPDFPPPSVPSAPVLPGSGDEFVTGLLHSITDGFCAFDSKWRFTFVNEAARRILAPHLGDPDELLGRVHWEVFPETRGTIVEREYLRAVAEGVPVEFEIFYEPWQQWFAVRGFPIRGGGMSGYFRDVTAEKAAASALRETEERYRTLFESVDQGACIIEVCDSGTGLLNDYRFVETNAAFQRQTGLAGAVGRTIREMVPEIESAWAETYARVAATGEPARFQERSEALGRNFDVYACRIGRPEQRQVAILFTDITEREELTRVVAESEERFRALAENVPQLAWMADGEGNIYWYNRRWYEYTGTDLTEMHGWGWEKVHHPEHIGRVVETWSRSLKDGVGWEDTFPLRGAGGEYRWFLSRAFPVADAHGKVQRWIGTNTDVTEQRAAVDALAVAKEAAEAGSRAKDEFLAALSHELRTPLTPVLLSAAALQEEERLPADVREQLGMMRRNIELESRLIDDLLDLTRIAHGKLKLREQTCDAHVLLRLALETVRQEAESKNLQVEVTLSATRTRLRCDEARVQQMFWNLLKNAVKFTPYGGRIRVSSREREHSFVLEVTDTGIGIAPELLEQIFRPFEQAGLANNHQFGGLGLGLSISRSVAEMHGGTLTAESAGKGRGATFRVELPVAETPNVEPGFGALAEAPAVPAGQPLRLLLVEDHEPTLGVLSRLLLRAGHQVFMASTIAGARELAAHHPFDAVVSDIGLPDGTGHELMAGLREAYGLSGVALTGYGSEEDHRRSRDAGFVAHLTKPVEFAELRRVLAGFTPQSR